MSRYCWPILTPIPHCHTFTHPMTPKSTSHISDPPIFSTLVQKQGQKPPVQIISQLFAGVFVRGFCQGSLVWKVLFGVVFSIPLLSEYICYNRNVNITLNFMFHMYDIKMYKREVTCF